MADVKPATDNNEPLIPVPTATTQATNATETDEPKITPSPSATMAADEETVAKPAEPKSAFVPIPDPAPAAPDSDLEDIKQKALTELRPLLDEVDLPADQKFHTILEIISATNDKSLIPKLYEAASGIEDKHEKAKALVDVVSEIEYLNSEASS